MPAMSPTMTEGGIASWKKKEGESFVQGDVLLEIETDKATIDVEAQEDGIVGKIFAPDGTKGVPVGKLIAILAEEGDDISNLEMPKDEPTPPPSKSEEPQGSSSSASSSAPSAESESSSSHSHVLPEHDRPLFPSVHRLLLEHGITSLDKIKGTGVRGMITKGDVLTHLGKASGPLGTFKFGPSPIEEALASKGKGAGAKGGAAAPPKTPLDGPSIRRLVVSSMLQASQKSLNPVPAAIKQADFDSIIADYLPPSPKSLPPTTLINATASTPKKSVSYLDGLV
ncbi:single hybrid motif-containing protein [Crepidotus variabilis]|uniref:Single hybrid motif-containing protein n=1 Tax=Crepidotus variabilis TaxID=179855 RepID=A0A9P6EPF6_9AGAR|nr:single hybrid motif-containing protein [Crepidotus variabilis]